MSEGAGGGVCVVSVLVLVCVCRYLYRFIKYPYFRFSKYIVYIYNFVLLFLVAVACVFSCIYNFKFLFPLKCIFAVTPNDIFHFSLFIIIFFFWVCPVPNSRENLKRKSCVTQAEYLYIDVYMLPSIYVGVKCICLQYFVINFKVSPLPRLETKKQTKLNQFWSLSFLFRPKKFFYS